MHQLGMTDFVIDLDRYLKELASTQNLIEKATTASKNSTPSASSSPLTKEEEVALTHTEIWWTGSNHDASLATTKPTFNAGSSVTSTSTAIFTNAPPVSRLPQATYKPTVH